MKKIVVFLFVIILLSLSFGCEIEEQNVLIRGKVIDWFSGFGIISAEISVMNSQYFELTNT